MNLVKLPPVVDIHPDKDELIVIERSECIAVSKGTWCGIKRGQQFPVTVYNIDGIITYSMRFRTYVGPHPKALYYRTPQYWQRKEFPFQEKELFEHFLLA